MALVAGAASCSDPGDTAATPSTTSSVVAATAASGPGGQTTVSATTATVITVPASGPVSGGTTGVETSIAPTPSTTLPRPTEFFGLFDNRLVHELGLEVDAKAYSDMLKTFERTQAKNWIRAAITIDGTRYDRVGIRLKGSTSLADALGQAGPIADLYDPAAAGAYAPWLIQMDRFVRGQNHLGYDEFVVRANDSPTALNEAVALDLLAAVGLPTQQAAGARVTVNGGTPVYRLVIENPADTWDARYFSNPGILYKAQSQGDYRYRGTRVSAYQDVFDQETGEGLDLRPLISFLGFVDKSDDAEFADKLEERLDVASFATYLAFEELVANYDDIDGPGNNSFLRWDRDTKRFTVVAWDHNLAFRGTEGLDLTPDPSGQGPTSNPLVVRFSADASFAALVESERVRLRTALIDGGVARQVLVRWAQVLARDAGDLVSQAAIDADVAAIEAYLTP